MKLFQKISDPAISIPAHKNIVVLQRLDRDRPVRPREAQDLDLILFDSDLDRLPDIIRLVVNGVGKALLNGTISKAAASAQSATTSSTFSFRVGDESGMTIDLKIMSMTATKLGFASGAAEFKASALGTATGTTTAITKIDAALTKALEAATTIGSVQERLGYTADNVATQIENLEASNSTVVESDVAKEITDYMKWSVLSQASQYMLAQSNQNAFSVLNLLQ